MSNEETPKSARKDRETKREERKRATDRELLELLHERLDDFDDWRDSVDGRLEEGDKRFGRIEANVGLSMNSLRTLCQARGLAVEAGMLDGALQDWEKSRKGQHANGAERDIPTNPDNERPPEQDAE